VKSVTQSREENLNKIENEDSLAANKNLLKERDREIVRSRANFISNEKNHYEKNENLRNKNISTSLNHNLNSTNIAEVSSINLNFLEQSIKLDLANFKNDKDIIDRKDRKNNIGFSENLNQISRLFPNQYKKSNSDQQVSYLSSQKKNIIKLPSLDFKKLLKFYSQKKGSDALFNIFLFLDSKDLNKIFNSGKRARHLLRNVIYEKSRNLIKNIKNKTKLKFEVVKSKLDFSSIKGRDIKIIILIYFFRKFPHRFENKFKNFKQHK
jgi:hypothetical protein